MLRRAITPILAIAVVSLLGCTGQDVSRPSDAANDDGTTAVSADPTPAAREARSLALDAAHRVLAAVDLDPASVDGSSRVRSCTDGLGQPTDQQYGEYSSGTSLGADALTDEQISSLGDVLGVEFLEDSVDDEGVRIVSFALPVGDASVIVTVSRAEDATATLTTVTPCVG